MKKIILTLFCFSSLSFSLSSCCKEINCTPGYATLSFVGFDIEDIKTFYLRRYKQNTSFTERIDTTVCSFTLPEFRQDSVVLKVSPNSGETLPSKDFYITGGYDYELVIPRTRQIFRITELIEENKQEKICGLSKRVCDTRIVGTKVNGTFYANQAVIRQ